MGACMVCNYSSLWLHLYMRSIESLSRVSQVMDRSFTLLKPREKGRDVKDNLGDMVGEGRR